MSVKPNWFGDEEERKEVLRHIAYLLVFGIGFINLATILVLGCVRLVDLITGLKC